MNSQTRTINVSTSNIEAFIETGLKSMKLINDNEQVWGFDHNLDLTEMTIHIKKEV